MKFPSTQTILDYLRSWSKSLGTTFHGSSERQASRLDGTYQDARCIQLETDLFVLANQLRFDHGLSKLKGNDKLKRSALHHACRMIETGEFDHVLADGVDLGDRLHLAGYRYRVCRENLAYILDPSLTLHELAWAIHDGWVKSPGHYANLVARDVTELGVAVHQDRSGAFFAVQNFGRAKSESPIVFESLPSRSHHPSSQLGTEATVPTNAKPLPAKGFDAFLKGRGTKLSSRKVID